ncbi:MAG TPA: cobalamin-dependent protein [Thermoanaerobaculia bacterium]|nr:cobalamin-dependent protein [Thermoanaerobaculia bacterium]
MSSHQRVAESLSTRRQELALRVAEKHLEQNSEFQERFGAVGRMRCIEDADFHLQYLSHAVRLATPALFTSYTQWVRQLLEKRAIGWHDLQKNLELLRDELARELDEPDAALIRDYIDAALDAGPADSESFLTTTTREPLARACLTALLQADRRAAVEIINEAVRDGLSIRDLYLQVFQPVQREIGRLWQNNDITVAEEHYCTASTQAMMAQFYPQILATPRIGRKVVVACVGSELHEIGTRMVADFFEMAGWDGVYIGANTPTNALIELVCRERPQLVALGITMTYHLGTAGQIIERLRADDRCSNVKVIAGGYVFQQHPELWRSLGVDGSALDAAGAVALGTRLVDGEH